MNFTRSKFDKVYIQAYDPITQRGKFLPRSETRHLDDLSDDEIWAFIREKQAEQVEVGWGNESLEHKRTVKSVLPAAVTMNFERWLSHLTERGLDLQTVRQHRSLGTRFVLEYFGRVAKEPDPARWPEYTSRFYTWLSSEAGRRLAKDEDGTTKADKRGAKIFERGPCSAHQIRLANITLRKFFRWMGEENIVPGVELRLRAPPTVIRKPILPRAVTPEQMLTWADECSDPIVKFIGLAGYFFSLRPQEVCALRPIDFRAGKDIAGLECVQVMKKAKLYSGLVVYVGRQKQTLGTIKESAKKGSNGWVACFNHEAAKRIVSIAQQFGPEEDLAKWNITKLYDDWRLFGPEGLTMKDMRRGSLHWLGQNSELQPLHLMKHARHRSIETTMIYTQRPEEQLKKVDPSSFSLKLDD